MCIAYTHDRTRISFQFLFIQNIYILFENERGWDFVWYHLFILFSSICLNEAVAQLTDEQRWWRHRVRCCSNCRYVLACSQVCAWSTDLPSTHLQVIESVVRVLGIEKRPVFRYDNVYNDLTRHPPHITSALRVLHIAIRVPSFETVKNIQTADIDSFQLRWQTLLYCLSVRLWLRHWQCHKTKQAAHGQKTHTTATRLGNKYRLLISDQFYL